MERDMHMYIYVYIGGVCTISNNTKSKNVKPGTRLKRCRGVGACLWYSIMMITNWTVRLFFCPSRIGAPCSLVSSPEAYIIGKTQGFATCPRTHAPSSRPTAMGRLEGQVEGGAGIHKS